MNEIYKEHIEELKEIESKLWSLVELCTDDVNAIDSISVAWRNVYDVIKEVEKM